MSGAESHGEQRCMQPPTAGPQHESIARFAGTWRAEVKLWTDPTSDPQVSTGKMKNTMVLNGLFLEQVYEDDTGYFSGRGFWGYNTVDQRYEGFWIDTMANMLQLEYGQHDPATDRWTMHGSMTDPSGNGNTIKKKSVITYENAEAHRLEMFFEAPGAPEVKCMEIAYKRA